MVAPTPSASNGRPFWRALYERDLDLVFLDLFHSSDEFRSRVLACCGLDAEAASTSARFVGAWHSIVDELGRESDLVAEWRSDDGHGIRLFIEDKIDACCQPGQAEAYAARAARCRAAEPGLSTRTLLVAPATYPQANKEDTAPFDRRLAIETIADWLDQGLVGDRGRYLSGMLRNALRRWHDRHVGGEGESSGKPKYPIAYGLVHGALPVVAPDLSISNPKPSAWIYFDFTGKKPGHRLRYRLADHWAELVFDRDRTSEADLRTALAGHPLPGASCAERGTTQLAVWCPTPEIDHEADGDEQRQPIRAALAVVASMKRWYLEIVDGVGRSMMSRVGGARRPQLVFRADAAYSVGFQAGKSRHCGNSVLKRNDELDCIVAS
jgi:hypothetical protein